MVTCLTNEVFDGNKEFTINPVVKKATTTTKTKQNKDRTRNWKNKYTNTAKQNVTIMKKKNPHCQKANQFWAYRRLKKGIHSPSGVMVGLISCKLSTLSTGPLCLILMMGTLSHDPAKKCFIIKRVQQQSRSSGEVERNENVL